MDYIESISLCTFSTGRIMVREVLEDWFFFLGGKPRNVIFSVFPAEDPPSIYEALRVEGLIDSIIYVDLGNHPV